MPENSEVAEVFIRELFGAIPKVILMARRQLPPMRPDPPPRMETRPRAHLFHSVATFVEYLDRVKVAGETVVLADACEQVVSCVIDESKEKGVERLGFMPQIHPTLKPWTAIFNASVPLSFFLEFVLRNRRAVVSPDPAELVLTFSQVKAAKDVTIERGRGATAINGVMVHTSIQGTKHAEPVDLPETITIEVPVYVDTEPQQIEVDLLVDVKDEEIEVYASSSQLEEAIVSAFAEIVDVVRGLDGVVAGFGKVSHSSWEYVDK